MAVIMNVSLKRTRGGRKTAKIVCRNDVRKNLVKGAVVIMRLNRREPSAGAESG